MVGKTISHFEVIDQIGAGGMGVVYRARDTRLGRDVAIKVLPDEVAADPERLARFDREAKVLASLNHPNIAAIYSLERAATEGPERSVSFLVMELAEGADLTARIASGPIPLDEALPIALQIAEAFETAHEKGIIHRDLKPANVKLDAEGKIKVLDFGLAKALEAGAAGGGKIDLSMSPTLTAQMTQAGVLMGTAAYMSPEQARGQKADRRADIWAFGVLLWEMLTGAKLFAGETVSDTLADVLRADPDRDLLPEDLPRIVRRLLDRCLDRDPRRRLRDIGEARVLLEDMIAGRAPAEPDVPTNAGAPSSKTVWPWIVAGAATVMAALSLVVGLRPEPASPAPVGRFTIDSPNTGILRVGDGRSIDISPDGRMVVNAGSGTSDTLLYVRHLDSFEPVGVGGTNGARLPFFSPDSRWIAYITSKGFWKVSVGGGAPLFLGTFEISPYGASWSVDGHIYFESAGRILRIPDSGGEAELLASPSEESDDFYRLPHATASGRHVLFSTDVRSGKPGRLLALDPASGQIIELGLQGTDGRHLSTGHLLFLRTDRAMVVGFDEETLQIEGTPFPVLERTAIDSSSMYLAVSTNGTVAYLPSLLGEARQILLVNRSGERQPLLANPPPFNTYNDLRLSPDGRRLAVTLESGAIWMLDLETETPTMLSESGFYPIWDPDSSTITFTSNRKESFDLHRVRSDLSGPETVLLDRDNNLRTATRAPDGTLVFREEVPGKGMDLWWWPDETDDSTIVPLMTGPDDELAPAISPDGSWMAYVSDQSGQDEIYVSAFPQPSGRVRASLSGGTSPSWSSSGRELYYFEGRKFMAVSVETEPTFRVLDRNVLFEGDYMQYRWQRQYDVHSDGEHFLMIENSASSDVEIITNWFTELDRMAQSAS